jgi:hypothetical protein
MDAELVLSEKSGCGFVPEVLLHPEQQRTAVRKASQSRGSARFAFMPTVLHPQLEKAQRQKMRLVAGGRLIRGIPFFREKESPGREAGASCYDEPTYAE